MRPTVGLIIGCLVLALGLPSDGRAQGGAPRTWPTVVDLTIEPMDPTSPDDWPEQLGLVRSAPDGSLLVGSTLPPEVRRYTWHGQLLSTVRDETWYSEDPFCQMGGLAPASGGGFYVVNNCGGEIVVFDQAGARVRTLPIPDSVEPPRSVTGLAVAPDGSLYLAQPEPARLLQLAPDGTLLAEWGSAGSDPGEFAFPEAVGWFPTTVVGLAATHQEVFVADWGNQRIQVFDASGTFLRAIALAFAPRFGDPFGYPGDIALTPAGHVAVTDWQARLVVIHTPEGRPVQVLGDPCVGLVGDGTICQWVDGESPGELIGGAFGVTIAPDGRAAVHSGVNVALFTPGGAYTGRFGLELDGPGLGTPMQPFGLTYDARGNLLVGGLYDIRIYSPEGQLTRITHLNPPTDWLSVTLGAIPVGAPLSPVVEVDGGYVAALGSHREGGLVRIDGQGNIQSWLIDWGEVLSIRDIELDRDGRLHVQVYDPDEVWTFEGDLRVARTPIGIAAEAFLVLDDGRYLVLVSGGEALMTVDPARPGDLPEPWGSPPPALDHPADVTWGPDGNVHVLDAAAGAIVRLTPDGSEIDRWDLPTDGDPSRLAYGPEGRLALAAGGRITVLASEIAPGWRSAFYARPDLTGLPLATTRVGQPRVAWGPAGPGHGLSPAGAFGLSLGRNMRLAEGPAEFRIVAPGGVRLRVNGELLWDAWSQNGVDQLVAVSVPAAPQAVRFEFALPPGPGQVSLEHPPEIGEEPPPGLSPTPSPTTPPPSATPSPPSGGAANSRAFLPLLIDW